MSHKRDNKEDSKAVAKHGPEAVKARACFTCGKQGHKAADCRMKISDWLPPAKSKGADKIRVFMKSARELCNKKNDLLRQKLEFERKYVVVDQKDLKSSVSPFDDSIALVDGQLKALKTEVGFMFGNKSMRITIPVTGSVSAFTTTSGTTGLVNSTFGVYPPNSSEFASLAALFDEYRCLGGVYEFAMPGIAAKAISTSSTNAYLSYSAIGIAYAPADNTAISGTSPSGDEILSEYEQHRWYATTQAASNQTSTMHKAAPYVFSFKVPDGVVQAGGASSPLGAGNWQSTNTATPATYGYLKSYSNSGSLVAAGYYCVVGVTYLHCEFRVRI